MKKYIQQIKQKVDRLDPGSPENTMKCTQCIHAVKIQLNDDIYPLIKTYDRVISDYKNDVGYVFILGSTLKTVKNPLTN
jgi:hypothetical protein